MIVFYKNRDGDEDLRKKAKILMKTLDKDDDGKISKTELYYFCV